MGCTVSTAIHASASGSKGAKQAVNDGLGPRVTPDIPIEPDPRLPLTAREKFNISKSWKAIARKMEITGLNMFIRLFETNDMVRTLFKALKGFENVTELRESDWLVGHVNTVMFALDEAIDNLHDLDSLIAMLTQIGKTHNRLEGFDPEIFWEIEQPFLLAVKETLEDRYTANVERIYGKVIHFILQTLIDGYRGGPQADKNGNPDELKDNIKRVSLDMPE